MEAIIITISVWLVYAAIAWVSSFFILTSIKRSKFNPKRLPPGPFPLPLVGNIFSLGLSNPHRSLGKLSNTYGPVMSLQLGFQTTIVISSPSMVKEVLHINDALYANRFVPDVMASHQEFSLAFRPADARWKLYRRICNTYVFSNAKLDKTQALRKKKIQDLVSHVQTCCESGKPVDIGQTVFTTILNFLSNTIFSIDLGDSDSPTAREFRESIDNFATQTPNLADFFPLLKPIDLQGLRKSTTLNIQKILNIFNRLITERLESRTVSTSTAYKDEDVLDALLSLTQDSTEFQLTDVEHLLFDLFTAATDTTTATIEWAMAELSGNPTKLNKVQNELKEVIGNGKAVLEVEDAAQLPYLRAVVKETLRMHPPAPFLIPRKVSENITLCNFTIPKNTRVIINGYAIGRDSNLWPNPNLFEPERFLGSTIDFKGHNFEFTPFGGGRRICPGMPLAIRMLHLILASLLHLFNWKLEDGLTPETLNMEDTFSVSLRKLVPLYAIPLPK